jgi:hypothetical protein
MDQIKKNYHCDGQRAYAWVTQTETGLMFGHRWSDDTYRVETMKQADAYADLVFDLWMAMTAA